MRSVLSVTALEGLQAGQASRLSKCCWQQCQQQHQQQRADVSTSLCARCHSKGLLTGMPAVTIATQHQKSHIAPSVSDRHKA